MKYFLSILLSSLPVILFGQPDFHFQHLTTNDGLPSNNIQCLMQDRRGYLWIGTDDGLSRYDGIQFVNYRHDARNDNSLVHNIIYSLEEDLEGNIWIGTLDGVSCYHVSTNHFENFFFPSVDPRISSDAVHSIVADQQGSVWLMADMLLQKFDPITRKFQSFPMEPHSIDNTMGHIAYDLNHTFWINGIEGLYSFDIRTHQFQRYPWEGEGEVAGGAQVMRMIMDGPVLWVTTWGAGLRKFDTKLKRFTGTYHYGSNPMHPSSTNIIPSFCNQVLPSGDTLRWVGSSLGPGLFNTQSQRFQFFEPHASDPPSIAASFISFILVDNQDILWMSSSSGLYLWDKKSSRIKSSKVDVLNYPNINFNTVVPDPVDPTIWLGTYFSNGLYQYNEITKEVVNFSFDPDPFSNKNSIEKIFADDMNRIWVCTGNGLYRYNRTDRKFTRIDEGDYPLKDHFFLGIDEVRHPVYLLTCKGSGGVLYDEQANQFNPIHPPGSLQERKEILCGYLDNSLTYWMGTRSGVYGYNLTTRKEWHFSVKSKTRHRLLNDVILTISGSNKNDIWIGSEDGLFQYNSALDSVIHYTTSDGLTHNLVYNVLVDRDENVWTGTRNGFSRFNTAKKKFSGFSIEDGLIANWVGGSFSQAADGRILIPSSNGYNYFMPQDLDIDTIHPPLVISSFRLNSQPFNWEAQMQEDSILYFKYWQNDFRIEFAALNFRQSKKNQYAYRLAGYNDEWIYTGSERSASYTNLDEGDYVFEVKGTNQDGLWSRHVATIKIHISPPFWKTYWFFVACFLSGVAAIFAYIHNRTSTLRKQKLVLESTVKSRTHELEIAKDRAEKSEQFKQQFLANMSHELRTPMNAVLGMTDLVMETPLNTKQTNYLKSIKKSSGHLLRILNDILDLSKIEAGKIELETIDFDIRSLALEVVQLLKNTAEEKQLVLQINIDDAIPQWVTGDPMRLNQVLINLVGNAIKFTEAGNVHLQIEKGERVDGIRFSIVDTGIGISSEKMNTIFESFHQAHSSDSRVYGGTGLGLTISKQLVELMGGRITLESKEGRGSKFSFELLLPKGTGENNTLSQTIDASILNGIRILVVDDTPDNRIVVKDTLTSKADVVVLEATNGKEALDLIRQHDFDLILMDVQMPIMDGYEATSKIRSQFPPPKNTTPIIGFTASILPGDLNKCLDAGMNDYVPKPFTLNQLLLTIAKVTAKELRFLPDTAVEQTSGENGSQLKVVDLRQLTIFCDGDETRILKYKQLFLDQVPRFSEEVQSAFSSGEYVAMTGILHSFRTKWTMMGMYKALELSLALEEECKKEIPDEKLIQLTLEQLFNQMQVAVEELIPEKNIN